MVSDLTAGHIDTVPLVLGLAIQLAVVLAWRPAALPSAPPAAPVALLSVLPAELVAPLVVHGSCSELPFSRDSTPLFPTFARALITSHCMVLIPSACLVFSTSSRGHSLLSQPCAPQSLYGTSRSEHPVFMHMACTGYCVRPSIWTCSHTLNVIAAAAVFPVATTQYLPAGMPSRAQRPVTPV